MEQTEFTVEDRKKLYKMCTELAVIEQRLKVVEESDPVSVSKRVLLYDRIFGWFLVTVATGLVLWLLSKLLPEA